MLDGIFYPAVRGRKRRMGERWVGGRLDGALYGLADFAFIGGAL